MSILAISLLILLGIVLLLVEFLIAPGITIAGIGGVLCIIAAVVFSYIYHGAATGHRTLLITVVSLIFFVVLALKSKTWNRVMLADTISGKVDYGVSEETVHIGDKGISITRLNPIGKVKVNDKIMEGKCITGYLDQNKEIEVVKLQTNNILVKPLN
ncbi:MAG: NfeD family protein [Bacteroidota bacterium]